MLTHLFAVGYPLVGMWAQAVMDVQGTQGKAVGAGKRAANISSTVESSPPLKATSRPREPSGAGRV